MDTKEELSMEIEKLLGIQLASLSRMNLDDLKALKEALVILSKVPEKERGQLLGPIFHRPIKEIVGEKLKDLDKQVGDLTLAEVIGVESDAGPLGLGLLPGLRKLVTGEKKQT